MCLYVTLVTAAWKRSIITRIVFGVGIALCALIS
jgi:hypothetical protein